MPKKSSRLITTTLLFPLLLVSIVTIFLTYLLLNTDLFAQSAKSKQNWGLYSQVPKIQNGEVMGAVTTGDVRVAKIQNYLLAKNRPILIPYAEDMVRVADEYQLHWALLPAISGQESQFCKLIPENSHNCWGWAIFGDNSHAFQSYPEAIERVGRSLREEFIDRYEYHTPCQIMNKYTPPSLALGGPWCKGVNRFISEMEAQK